MTNKKSDFFLVDNSKTLPMDMSAESYGNSADVEYQWAIKCHDHAEVHYSLISSVDPVFLKLTPVDNEIYKKYKEKFSNLKLDLLNEDEIKSESSKFVWREFCESFKDIVEDYNFGTLLRLDSTSDYNPKNTILVPRIQFLAIEIARNIEGYNSCLRKKKTELEKEAELET